MLALRKLTSGVGLALVDSPEPSPPTGSEVLVGVHWSGICGSDLAVYDWMGHGTAAKVPVTLGHEAAGMVLAKGSEVRDLSTGDRVVLESTAACRQCELCERGLFNMCQRSERIGHDVDGAFAAKVKVDAGQVYRVPAGVGLDIAALAKPYGVAVHAFERAPVTPGQSVIVVGTGTIGIMCATVAQLSGARVLLLGDADETRRGVIAALGLPVPATTMAEAEERMSTGGSSAADVVIEASGREGAMAEAVELVARGGTVAAVGLTEQVRVPGELLVTKEVEIRGVMTRQPTTWRRVLNLFAHPALDLAPLITHRLPLAHWETGMEAMRHGRAIKVLFDLRE